MVVALGVLNFEVLFWPLAVVWTALMMGVWRGVRRRRKAALFAAAAAAARTLLLLLLPLLPLLLGARKL